MLLEELLAAFDATEANLGKLDTIWERAKAIVPPGIEFGSPAEYDDLRRAWEALAGALPPIDGFTLTEQLIDLDELAQWRFDAQEIGEFNAILAADAAVEAPGKQLAEYKFRYAAARRKAVRDRVHELVAEVDRLLLELVTRVPVEAQSIVDPAWDRLGAALDEITRLLADTVTKTGRWSDLGRHLFFGQGHDLRDIRDMDWPSVKPDILAAVYAGLDPVPVAHVDLGEAASGRPGGRASTALAWERLTSEDFERLLADLLTALQGYQNVVWITKTTAPDAGRDLSAEKVTSDDAGLVRTDRVVVQAKHWLRTSIKHTDIANMLSDVVLLEPPPVDWLVIATSGALTARAHEYVEKHNADRKRPYIDVWGEHRLTGLLARHPGLVASYGLRA